MLQKVDTRVRTTGIALSAVVAQDLDVAQEFYVDVLGMEFIGTDLWPECGTSVCLATGSGQNVVLSKSAHRNDPTVSAAHQGFSVSVKGRDAILDKVRARGGEIHNFREDRPIEAENDIYLDDPFGNRIQLVRSAKGDGAGVAAIDHVAIEVNDILWSEVMFGDWLGLDILHRVGWNTQDYMSAKSRGEAGMKEAMPGSRYWNERYSPFETERKALRPCPQIYLDVGQGCSLVVYLAARHYETAPDHVTSGTPRVAVGVAPGDLAIVGDTFQAHDIPYEGPVRHAGNASPAESVYLREPGGNFLEFVET